MKRLFALCALASLTGLMTIAAEPVGAPKAGLEPGNFGLALEYSYTNLNLNREFRGVPGGFEIDNLHIAYLSGSYGVTEWLEVFLRVGLVEARSAGDTGRHILPAYSDYDFDRDFIYGGGARFTLGTVGDVTFGGVASYSWTSMDGTFTRNLVLPGSAWDGMPLSSGTMTMRMQQAQLALGATWEMTERVAIYGGGLMHWVRADLNREVTVGALTVNNNFIAKNDHFGSMFGGYLGTVIGLTDNMYLALEGTFTDDTKGGNAMLGWNF